MWPSAPAQSLILCMTGFRPRLSLFENRPAVGPRAILPGSCGRASVITMKKHDGIALGAAFIAALFSTSALAGDPPTSGPAANGSPAWHFQPGSPDPVGRTLVDDKGQVTVLPRQPGVPGPVGGNLPGCAKSTICTRKGGPSRQLTPRVVWDQMSGYAMSFPLRLPPAQSGTPGGAPGAAVDSKGNVWVLQRRPQGQPQLFKFDRRGQVVVTVPADEIGYQEKAHGIAVDPQDNVWITDTNGGTVQQVSPEGKLLKTIGIKDQRGDWDEAKGQRLLWQPVSVAFAANGDMYIGEGHANESPNDVDSVDPTNVIGAARVKHFDKDGKFLGQWFGDDNGPGKFGETHGLAVDPRTGDVWVGDREQYRIIIFNSDGKFLRTIQMRNLVCSIAFDSKGEPWVSTGQDGQIARIDRSGKVLGALGGGMGIEPGKFIEANYFAFDRAGAIYVGDTSIARITKFTPGAGKP